MTNALSTLSNIDVIAVDCRKFGGLCTLDDSEVSVDDEQVATKGNKRIIDGQHLRPFASLKYAYMKICLRYGTGFMGGFAIPKEKTDLVLEELARIKVEWDATVEDFLVAYPAHVEEWAQKKPSWADSIRRDAPSVGSLRRSFRFSYQAFEVNPSLVENAGSMVEEDLGSLSYKVCKDVADEMKENFRGDKQQVSQKTRRVLERARDKFLAFAFLDPVLSEAAEEIQKTLDFLPKQGSIKDTPMLVLLGLVGTLQQPHKVLSGMLSMQIPDGPADGLFADEADGNTDDGFPVDTTLQSPAASSPDVAEDAPLVETTPPVDSPLPSPALASALDW